MFTAIKLMYAYFVLKNLLWIMWRRLRRQRNRAHDAVGGERNRNAPGYHAPVTLGYYAQKYGLRPEQFPKAYLADRLSLTLPSLRPNDGKPNRVWCVTSLREAVDA